MTKSRQKGRNEFTEAVKREAMRTGQSIVELLEQMREDARKAKDTKKQKEIVAALKYVGRRNRNKRRGRQ